MRFADLADKCLDAAVCHIDTTEVQSVARAADSQKISISVSTWDTTQEGQFDDLVLETADFDLADLAAVRIGNKNIIFPFINVPQEWINDFLGIEKEYEIDYENEDIGESFMGFLTEINPQFKENVLAASSFLETHQK